MVESTIFDQYGNPIKICEYCEKPALFNRRYCHIKHRNKISIQLCECGCGQMTKPGLRFVHGHNLKTKESISKRINTLKANYISGKRKAWNKDLTITDPRIANSIEAMQHSENPRNRGQQRSKLTKQRHRETMLKLWGNDEWKKQRLSVLKSPQAIEKFSITMKQKWQDPEFAKFMAMAQNKKPNNEELQFLTLLQEIDSAWEYVGDYKVCIAGKNPDYINKNIKYVAEYFGSAFHNTNDEQNRKKHFAQYGWPCIVIWDYEFKKNIDAVYSKIVEAYYA